MRWAEPAWLIFLVLAIVPLILEWRRPRLAWPSLTLFPRGTGRIIGLVRWIPPLLRSLGLAALVLAMARPQTVAGQVRIAGRGLAIVLVLDRSSSMTAAEPTEDKTEIARLDYARRTLDEFIANRPEDLIGLVAFANYPDLVCPPTLDHETLRAALAAVKPARSIDDGTNIGDAIAWSCEALRSSQTTKKVIILLTDGANDPAVPNPLDPTEAASLAHSLGITLHTIAVGVAGGLVHGVEPTSKLPVPALADGPDIELLKRLADLGGGRAFHAENPGELSMVFEELDQLESSPISGYIRTRYSERFGAFAILAVSLFALDRLWSTTRKCRIP
jgi:Ca-activated chloride channel homolog